MTQTFALIVDAYRELNAKKLFWITLVLSGLVGSLFAMVGFTESGITLIVWDFPSPLNTRLVDEATLYKLFFQMLGIFWLTWVATVLAVVSTSSIFPDFVSGGSIEMLLSKPISRIQLYLTKYVLGLMFVLGQVACFTGIAILAIGIRGGVWEPKLLLAIPIVVLFFSYLFCFNALIGTITRSTIAALLATLLFWAVLAGVNIADGILLSIKSESRVQLEQSRTHLGNMETITQAQIDKARRDGVETVADGDGELPEGVDELEAANPLIKGKREEIQAKQLVLDGVESWHDRIIMVKTVLPKTSDTIGLLDRLMYNEDERDSLFTLGNDSRGDQTGTTAQERAAEEQLSRSLGWIIGTSLGFEAFILLLGAGYFARRDY